MSEQGIPGLGEWILEGLHECVTAQQEVRTGWENHTYFWASVHLVGHRSSQRRQRHRSEVVAHATPHMDPPRSSGTV